MSGVRVGASYIGRFAPSPTGPLHAGSLVAALASWLDARAHGGQWLVRIEDVDTTRCLPGIDQMILQQLAACGLHSDRAPIYQSQRSPIYQNALDELVALDLAYPCACTRKDIETARQHLGHSKTRHGELIYPGTCRSGLHGKAARAWRLRTDVYIEKQTQVQVSCAQEAINLIAKQTALQRRTKLSSRSLHWTDRRLGVQQQDVASEVGDFVLRRADACYAYQLAVVVDDAAQGITDVVRGADLVDNTARQILLQRDLQLPTPRYLHTPLVLGNNGEKLSKQNGAAAIDTATPAGAYEALQTAARVLGLAPTTATDLASALQQWVAAWPRLVHRDGWTF